MDTFFYAVFLLRGVLTFSLLLAMPDMSKHNATPEARKSAESREIKGIVQRWSTING